MMQYNKPNQADTQDEGRKPTSSSSLLSSINDAHVQVTEKDKSISPQRNKQNDKSRPLEKKKIMIDPKCIKSEPIDDGYESVGVGVSDAETESFSSEHQAQDLSNRITPTTPKYDLGDLQKIALDADKVVRHGGAMVFREIMEINNITEKINNLEKVSKELNDQSKRINEKLQKIQENQYVTGKEKEAASAHTLIDLRDSIPTAISVCPNVNISHGVPNINISHGVPPQEFAQVRQRLEGMRQPSPEPLNPRFIPRMIPRFVAAPQFVVPPQTQAAGRWPAGQRIPFMAPAASDMTVRASGITPSHISTITTGTTATVASTGLPGYRFQVPQIATVRANGVVYNIPVTQYFVRNPNPPPPYPSSPRKRGRNNEINRNKAALQSQQQQQHQQNIDQQQQTILHQLLTAGSRPQFHPQEHLPRGPYPMINTGVINGNPELQAGRANGKPQILNSYVVHRLANPVKDSRGHPIVIENNYHGRPVMVASDSKGRPAIIAGKEVQVIPGPSPVKISKPDFQTTSQSIAPPSRSICPITSVTYTTSVPDDFRTVSTHSITGLKDIAMAAKHQGGLEMNYRPLYPTQQNGTLIPVEKVNSPIILYDPSVPPPLRAIDTQISDTSRQNQTTLTPPKLLSIVSKDTSVSASEDVILIETNESESPAKRKSNPQSQIMFPTGYTSDKHVSLSQTREPTNAYVSRSNNATSNLYQHQKAPNIVSTGSLEDIIFPSYVVDTSSLDAGLVVTWNSLGSTRGLHQVKAYQLVMKEIPNSMRDVDVESSLLGTVGALPLPMMSTIQDLNEDSFYSFAIRPVHVSGRLGPLSTFSMKCRGR